MADYLVTDTELTTVANAIRTRGGTSASLECPDEFVTAIENIPTGGTAAISIEDTTDSAGGTIRTITALDISDTTAVAADVASGKYFYTSDGTKTSGTASGGGGTTIEEKDVNFIDYDGTLVASKTKAEINAMSSDSDLPSNPSHTGLTAQGWNWTVAQLKTQLAAMPNQPIWVGQMYVTSSGKTEIDIELTDSNFLHPYLLLTMNGSVTIDWGDDSAVDSLTGSSSTTEKFANHEYSSIGNYTIKIAVTSGTGYLRNGGSSYASILRAGSSSSAYRDRYPRVYSDCIKHIRIGTNIQLISRAMTRLTYLESITLPSNIVFDGDNIFDYTYNLKSIIIPPSVTSLSQGCFDANYNLSIISLPYTLTTVNNSTFAACYRLDKITIPNSLTTIGQNAFSSNTSSRKEAIYLPSVIDSLSKSAFSNNYLLRKVVLPSTITTLPESTFSNCYSLNDVTIPNTVTTIEKNAFYNCYSLTKINIPYGVTSLGDNVFWQCYSINVITIPSTVTSIGKDCFYCCYNIIEYHFLRETPPTLGQTAFSGIQSGTLIYVPYSADHSIRDAYKTATNWSAYAAYIKEEPQ